MQSNGYYPVISATLSTSQVLKGTYDQLQARLYKLKPGAKPTVYFSVISNDYVAGVFLDDAGMVMERKLFYPQDEAETIKLTGEFVIVNK